MIWRNWPWQLMGWLAFPLLLFLAGVIFCRRLHREFPLFLGFILVALASGVARLIAYHYSYATYYFTYWFSNEITACFGFAAVYELFLKRLFPGFYKIRAYRNSIAFAIILVGVAGSATALIYPSGYAVFQILDRILTVLQVSVLGFFVLLMLVMGREWGQHDLGICLGFGINAAAVLIRRAHLTLTHYHGSNLDWLQVVADDLAALVWLIFFLVPEKRSRPGTGELTPERLAEARSWEKLLKGPDRRE